MYIKLYKKYHNNFTKLGLKYRFKNLKFCSKNSSATNYFEDCANSN